MRNRVNVRHVPVAGVPSCGDLPLEHTESAYTASRHVIAVTFQMSEPSPACVLLGAGPGTDKVDV